MKLHKSLFLFLFLFLKILVAVSIILLRLWVQLDHRVDTHDGNTGLHGTLKLLNLTHAGFQDTGLQAVVDAALHQVEAVVLVRLFLGDGLLFLVRIAFLHTLRKSMADSKLGNEFGGVLGGVDGQSLRDDEERLSKFTNGQLLPGALL